MKLHSASAGTVTALRAVILLGFMLVVAFQQGAHAGVSNAPAAYAAQVDHHDASAGSKAASHDHAAAGDSHALADAGDHDDAGGQLCKVHCAPCPALVVEWQLVAPLSKPCFAPQRMAGLVLGELPTLIRPPRA